VKVAFWRLFMIPSAYGFLVWGALLLLVNINLIDVNISTYAWFVFLYVLGCFFLSSCFFLNFFKKIDIGEIGPRLNYRKIDAIIFLFSTVIGLYGLYLYVRDFSVILGGFFVFFQTFFVDPLVIRALAVEETSIGFQISYLSWISIYYCIFLLSKSGSLAGWGRFFVVSLLLIEVFLNLLFVDRTRPVILLVVCFVAFILIAYKRLRYPFYFLCFAAVGLLIIFFTQAIFTGKYDAEDGLFNNFLIYVFGGFGYFSVVLSDVVPDYGLLRTFYPLAKLMQAIGLVSEVPNQILEFRDVPFTTNVGTFLEPMFSDGGIFLIALGVPILIFMVDSLAYFSIASKKVFGLFVWGNLVLINVLGFFVPKYNSTSLYLFCLVYVFCFLNKARDHSEIR
jgi:oligosaccharide repeat unit polymerase